MDWDNDWDGCCFRGYGYGWGAAAAAAVTTAAVYDDIYDDFDDDVGATVYVLPSNCSTVVVDGVTYQQCGDTWYQPYFSGADASYLVVSPPQ